MSHPDPKLADHLYAKRLEELEQQLADVEKPMRGSTTPETPTMRERLARNAARRYFDDFDWSLLEYPDREAYADAYWSKFVDGVDEDLREMLEPSEGQIDAMMPYLRTDSRTNAEMAFSAAFESLLNETQD